MTKQSLRTQQLLSCSRKSPLLMQPKGDLKRSHNPEPDESDQHSHPPRFLTIHFKLFLSMSGLPGFFSRSQIKPYMRLHHVRDACPTELILLNVTCHGMQAVFVYDGLVNAVRISLTLRILAVFAYSVELQHSYPIK